MALSTKFREFSDARDFVRKLGLQSNREWRKYLKSVEKPDDIPAAPDKIYKKEWKGYSDWLGHFTRHTGYKKILPYDEAKTNCSKFFTAYSLHLCVGSGSVLILSS